jgi:voltage-gated potassium channel
MAHEMEKRELENASYEIFILLMSLLSLFNIAIIMLPHFSPVSKQIVGIIDLFISIIFISDFLYRLFSAESKTHYFFRNWGWADLLASLPAQQLKIFRIFRIIRVIRLIHAFGMRNLIRELRKNRAGSALYLTVYAVIFVLEFGSAAIIYVESGDPTANIKTATDGIWWGFVTITTVGYGDIYPVTNTGRAVGMIVMTLGVGLFGVLTGFLANAFLPTRNGAPPSDQPMAELDGPDGTVVAEFRRLLEEQERTNASLKAQLTQIEILLKREETPTTESIT